MQCPLCAAEIGDDVVACDRCGATRVTRRTPAGIVVGWLGMTLALLMVMMFAFLVALPFFGISLAGFPWPTLIIGTLISAADSLTAVGVSVWLLAPSEGGVGGDPSAAGCGEAPLAELNSCSATSAAVGALLGGGAYCAASAVTSVAKAALLAERDQLLNNVAVRRRGGHGRSV